jgi:hypothetical protein
MPRIVITGSRDWLDARPIRAALEALARESAFSEVIVGGARGVDRIAEREARNLGLRVRVFHADWDAHGKSAGYRRNELMLNQRPTAVWAFWDQTSRGTLHTMREARKRRLPLACWIKDPSSGVTRMVRDRIPSV